MSEQNQNCEYYILAATNPERMLLSAMPRPTNKRMKDGWQFGRIFTSEPDQPVIVVIPDAELESDLMPFFDSNPVVSNEFYETLLKAGVDNLDAYDAVLRSEDGTVEFKGFKAINIIGLISATGSSTGTRTGFTGDYKSISASMDGFSIDASKTKKMLMFRLAENTSTIIVHKSVKQEIEKAGFPFMDFRVPEDAFIL